MRILILDTYYDDFLSQCFAKNSSIPSWPYEAQWRALQDECFGTADFYSVNLSKFGHEATEIVMNCSPLQRQWAREHKIDVNLRFASTSIGKRVLQRLRPASADWLYVVLAAQIKAYKPDVLYIQDMNWLNNRLLSELRQHTKFVVGQIACPISPALDLRLYDLIISSLPNFVERFRREGLDSEYVKLAFEPKILPRLTRQTSFDVVFVGYLSNNHKQRLQFMEKIASAVGLDIWGPGAEVLDSDSALRRRHHGKAWALDMYQVLHQAKIVVNHHIDLAETYANNMRLFEATGVGSMLVTDAKRNLGEMFEIGRELIAYETTDDAINQIRYYLEHEQQRQAIAQAGQQRTLRDHTYGQRVAQLDHILCSLLAGRRRRSAFG